ncbi:DUF6298 domain-containing protein [Paludibaculum fermentans]|uniref:DUF6298 domain-containing protein n=1 Tax=Paludibaculum fermentans TaxID=1473598 RepID=UPI003EBA8B1F
MRRTSLWLASIVLLSAGTGLAQQQVKGPLRVLKSNPRWFEDGTGKAVLLTGSHTWQNLQDNGLLIRGAVEDPPTRFDYDDYLARLKKYNHNFFRLWRWETTKWTDGYTGNEVKYSWPHPWVRSGPDSATDGKPRFDLERFDESYFQRMRTRVEKAGAQGMYVSVMLFDGWEIEFTDAWLNHPFHKANNINGVEADTNGDDKGLEYNTLATGSAAKRVLELQQAYVRKVVDTVNDLDNVLYEICNEGYPESTAWQYHLIQYIKEYEAKKPKQHPVGMTFQYKGGTNATLNQSPADWISPNSGDAKESYRDEPCGDCSPKVVVNDTDHLWGHTGGDNIWVWRSFTRGLNVLFMEEMLPSPTWQDSARLAMGQARRYANRMNLAAMKPEGKLSGTGYALVEEGREYLIFQSNKGEFTLDLTGVKGTFQGEWLDVSADRTLPAKSVEGGGIRTFTTPFPGPAALYLKIRE